MKNFILNQFEDDQSLSLNAIILLFAVLLLSSSIIFYLIGLFAHPSLENFFVDVASIFFLSANATFIIYLFKVTIESLIIYLKNSSHR